MDTMKVLCPVCGAFLRVPEAGVGRRGRCASCGKVFTIAAPSAAPETAGAVSDDEILGWLGPLEAKPQPAVVHVARKGKSAPAVRRPRKPSPPGVAERKSFTVRLGHVDEMGAFFLFSAELLYDEVFRSSFPQRCTVCGGRRHLSVHLVLWSSMLPERGQFGLRTSYSPTVYELDKLGGIEGRDLLGLLNPIENLPEPYCLPFPYYVCQSCSAVGAVVTDVRLSADQTRHVCELGISSLKRAEEFLVAIGGQGTQAQRRIRRALQESEGDAWRAIPLAVRTRIKQWYEQQPNERFVAYIPDEDFAKTEAGMAGIVLTNNRLLYRKLSARVEIPLTQEMTISRKIKGRRELLEIKCPGCQAAVLAAGMAGTDRLRQCLQRQKVRAHWLT